MGNSNQPKQMPNQKNSTQAPNKSDKNVGNDQKNQVRPGQQNSDSGTKKSDQK